MRAEEKVLGDRLFELEKQLVDPEIRKDRKRVSALLHEEFREFGSSGRAWSRDAILDMLRDEPAQALPELTEFAVKRLGPMAALVTYRATRPGGSTLRSSLWVSEAGEWRMLFHQGTKAP